MAMVLLRNEMWMVGNPLIFSSNYKTKLICGSRMAVMNLALAFFLALKNTPLAFLMGLSYEKLNVLHRWTGRTTFVFACLHVL